MATTCYMCDKPATSREHAPPRCLFPASEHSLNGKNQRVNLITAPSCDEHNGEKSVDDRYLMFVLRMSIGSNDVAAYYFQSKVKESIVKNNSIVKSAVSVIVHDLGRDEWNQAEAFEVDNSRLLSVLDMNARAIYYRHRKVKLMAKMSAQMNFTLLDGSPRLNDLMGEVLAVGGQLLDHEGAEPRGANQEVFYYRIARVDSIELIEFTFYGLSKVLFSIDHSAI